MLKKACNNYSIMIFTLEPYIIQIYYMANSKRKMDGVECRGGVACLWLAGKRVKQLGLSV